MHETQGSSGDRVLKQFQSEDATIAKLFAKHIKLNDAIDHAKKTRFVCLGSLVTADGTS